MYQQHRLAVSAKMAWKKAKAGKAPKNALSKHRVPVEAHEGALTRNQDDFASFLAVFNDDGTFIFGEPVDDRGGPWWNRALDGDDDGVQEEDQEGEQTHPQAPLPVNSYSRPESKAGVAGFSNGFGFVAF